MTKDKKPLKIPKGNVLVEFLVDLQNGKRTKGVRKVTSKETAEILIKNKKAKIIKEYAKGEILTLAAEKVDYMNPDKK